MSLLSSVPPFVQTADESRKSAKLNAREIITGATKSMHQPFDRIGC